MVRCWLFSPGTQVSLDICNWLNTIQPECGRKSDDNRKFLSDLFWSKVISHPSLISDKWSDLLNFLYWSEGMGSVREWSDSLRNVQLRGMRLFNWRKCFFEFSIESWEPVTYGVRSVQPLIGANQIPEPYSGLTAQLGAALPLVHWFTHAPEKEQEM